MVFRTIPGGETAKLLGFNQAQIEALFNEGTLAIAVQGKIAERNIFQAQQQLEQSFQEQREVLTELHQPSIPEIMPVFEPMIQPIFELESMPMETRSLCPIFDNTDEGV